VQTEEAEKGELEMSKKNNMDVNRIDGMISAALYQDEELLPLLAKMADRWEEPIDALAAFLVGDGWYGPLNFMDYPDNHEDGDMLPCTEKQWDFFLSRCREATKNAHQKINSSDKKALERFAIIGQWPSIPFFIEGDSIKPFLKMGFELAWAYAWTKKPEDLNSFYEGSAPSFKCSWDSGSWNIALGLCDALQWGMVEKPEDPVPFVLAYANWYGGPGNASVSHLCYWGLNLKPCDLSIDDLQVLATVWESASMELGRRQVPLLIPMVQKSSDWVWGLLETIEVDGDLEKDVETFNQSECAVLRYELWKVHNSRKNTVMVKNPDDPFGPKVNKFCLLTKQFDYPSFPTYEDGLSYIQES
jgi:hypothetical protein